MAKAKSAGKLAAAGAAPKSTGFGWIPGLVCGAVLTLATPIALLLSLLLAPAAVGMLLDRTPGRMVGRAMLLFAAAASLQPLIQLWHEGHGFAPAVRLMGDLGVVGTAWLGAGIGWLLGEFAPLAVRMVVDMRNRSRGLALRRAREQIVRDWGEIGGREG